MSLFTPKGKTISTGDIERTQYPNGLGTVLMRNFLLGRVTPYGGFTSDVRSLQQVALPTISQITTVSNFISENQPGTDLRNFEKPVSKTYDGRLRGKL